MKDKIYDVLIVGGGPGGYSSAIYAAKEGLSVLLFEGGTIGGTCLNVGCIPTKFLLDKGALFEKIRKLADQKILKEPGLYSFSKIQSEKMKVVQKLVAGVEYLLKANKIDIVRGFAQVKDPGRVICEGKEYFGKNIILATGSEPVMLPIPGVEHAIDSTTALSLKKVPRQLVVIGGGVIGMELASVFRSFGAEVTVLEALPELFPAEGSASINYLKKELEKRGIKILCNAKVKSIEKSNGICHVFYKGTEDGIIEADAVLVAAGRKANLKGIDTEALGLVLTEKKEISVDSYMRTNVKGIYAIGDVAGGYQLAHAAYAEGETAVNHILGKTKQVDLKALPRCVYTIPPFAAVGLCDKKAAEKGIKTAVGNFSYSGNGMALAENEEGMVTVIIDRDTEETIGIEIVGAGAPEMLATAAFAVAKKFTVDQWREMIVAHPSLSEMLREAAFDSIGKSIHGPVK